MSGHIEELAELYALGSLDARERATVERHVRTCGECANRIRAAEETIAFISDLEQHHEPPQAIAGNFAARLAASRAAQKLLSLKVTGTVLGAIVLILSLAYVADERAATRAALADRSVSSVASVSYRTTHTRSHLSHRSIEMAPHGLSEFSTSRPLSGIF